MPDIDDRSYFRRPHDGAVSPRDLKVRLADQTLSILWKDGATSTFPLAGLRALCPCATCRTEREQQTNNPLRILKFNPEGLEVISAELVGHYAIQFQWSDGHKSGIFDFRFLRALHDQRGGEM